MTENKKPSSLKKFYIQEKFINFFVHSSDIIVYIRKISWLQLINQQEIIINKLLKVQISITFICNDLILVLFTLMFKKNSHKVLREQLK